MAETVNKVAVAGGTGNLGPAIVQALVDAGFQVTVLTRPSSKHSLPAKVNVAQVDYDSLDSLLAALKGQDALISTLASLALSKQLLLIEAASKAGVKRFLPSEFGSNTVHPVTSKLPVYHDKIIVQEALRKQANERGMTYTILCNGPFLDWGIMVGFVLDLKHKKVNLFDGGERKFSATTLPTVGRAVVGVLKKLKETENRVVYVQDIAISATQLLTMGKKAVGPEGWTERVVPMSQVLQEGYAELSKEKPDPDKFVFNFLQAAIWGEGYGALFDKLDNHLLGIEEMKEPDVQAIVDKFAK